MAPSSPVLFCDLEQNAREVFVCPLLWTSHHFDILGCRFENVEIPTSSIELTQSKRNTKENIKIRKERELDTQKLAEKASRAVSYDCLRSILLGEGSAFATKHVGSGFFFAGIQAHRPYYTVFHRHGHPKKHIREGSPLLVGHLNYGDVGGRRFRMFSPRPGPRGCINYAGWGLGAKKSEQVTPEEWTEDPYFVCPLLALAQLQERRLRQSPKPRNYTSRLLVSNMFEQEYIYLYDTEITGELLSALAKPKSATKPVQRPVIRRIKIPYKPYDTFSDRLSAELVAPGRGHFDPTPVLSDKPSPKRQLEQESTNPRKLNRVV